MGRGAGGSRAGGTGTSGGPWYHFTREANVASIQEEGLRATDGIAGVGVYLTSDAAGESINRRWSDTRLRVEVDAPNTMTFRGVAHMSDFLESRGFDTMITEPREAFGQLGVDAVRIERGGWFVVWNPANVRVVEVTLPTPYRGTLNE